MKLIPAFLITAVAAVAAAASAPPPCCVAPTAAEEAASAPAAPLSSRSLYQLEVGWTNDAGEPVRLTAFRGRPVLVAMIFANCEYACPVLVNDLKRLRAALPEAIRREAQLVLVSFDVKRDTPPALRAFRERMDLDEAWHLLTGSADAVQELAMLLGVKFKPDARGQFAHSNLITCLNTEGETIHQLAGLNGDVAPAAAALVKSAERSQAM